MKYYFSENTTHTITKAYILFYNTPFVHPSPKMTIREIARNLGFYDEYHFSKQFKKIAGVSPREFKKQSLD